MVKPRMLRRQWCSRPSMRRWSRPHRSSTLTCLEIAGGVMVKPSDSSPTVRSPRASRSTMRLRVGSANAVRTSSNSRLLTIGLTIAFPFAAVNPPLLMPAYKYWGVEKRATLPNAGVAFDEYTDDGVEPATVITRRVAKMSTFCGRQSIPNKRSRSVAMLATCRQASPSRVSSVHRAAPSSPIRANSARPEVHISTTRPGTLSSTLFCESSPTLQSRPESDSTQTRRSNTTPRTRAESCHALGFSGRGISQ